MNVRYRVDLDADERKYLKGIVGSGTGKVRRIRRAQILLAADRGVRDIDITEAMGSASSTIYRTKKRFVEEGLEQALSELPRPGAHRKLVANEEALLVATACSKPPVGSARWTLKLLAGRMVELTDHEFISDETIRRRLKEVDLKPWRRKMWCIPNVCPQFVAAMEDVLDLYAREPDPAEPTVSFDETPIQLIGETRTPIPAGPGRPRRFDYEYKRNGTANLFVFVDAHRPWRFVKATRRRTNLDFAECMRDLVDCHYPNARLIHVVLDNLSTHKPGALYEAFEPCEARRILRRLQFHYTPKHASWLNMVEIEISVLSSQCLARRIPKFSTLRREVTQWAKRRNREKAQIRWLFGVEQARRKMGRAYPESDESKLRADAA